MERIGSSMTLCGNTQQSVACANSTGHRRIRWTSLSPDIPGVRKAHAQWDKVPVRQAAQHPVERQRDQFGKLPPRHVKSHHGLKGQDRLVFVVRDLKANFVV